MANELYPKWKEQLLQFTANNNLSAGTVKVALIDTGAYQYNASHQYWSSASAGAIGTPQTLTSKTFTDGVFDAADVTFSAVTGDTIEAIIIYIDTGTASTSPLVAYMDTGITGFPLTPTGVSVTINWSPSGIFQL